MAVFQNRVIEVTDRLRAVVPNGLVMCPDASGQYDICGHDDCRKAVVIIANEKGEYVDATGRTRVPCSKSWLRLPVCSDGKGGVRTCNWGSNEITSHELGFILQVHPDGEVDLFTRGSGTYA